MSRLHFTKRLFSEYILCLERLCVHTSFVLTLCCLSEQFWSCAILNIETRTQIVAFLKLPDQNLQDFKKFIEYIEENLIKECFLQLN